MDIVSQLILVTFIFVALYGVIVAQVIALRRALRSTAWTLLMSAYIIGGLLQIWRLLRLPIMIMQAKVKGVLPETLTFEQWATVVVSFLIVILLILGFNRLRRDLRKVGI